MFLYLLKCKDGSIYTGIAKDVQKRFLEHRSGKGAKYTRSRKAVKILYMEKHKSISVALKREIEIKRWNRAKKLALIKGLL